MTSYHSGCMKIAYEKMKKAILSVCVVQFCITVM